MNSVFRLRLLAVLLISTALALSEYYWGQLTLSHEQMRAETLARANAQALLVASVEAQHIEALLLGIDLVLRQFREAIHSRYQPNMDDVAGSALKAFPDGSLMNFTAIDANGRLSYSNAKAVAPGYFGDRDYFKLFQRNDQDRLFINKPVRSRITDQWVVVITRPIFNKRRFSGVANVTLSPQYLAKSLAQLELGSRDVVTLLFEDGAYLARSQRLQEVLGKTLPSDRPFLAPGAPSQGVFRAVGNSDQVPRIFAWKKLRAYPLLINVGLDEEAILAPIEREIFISRSRSKQGILLLFALFAVVSMLLFRMARKQEQLYSSKDRFSEIFNNVNDAILIHDADTRRITEVNRRMCEMFGYTPEEAINCSIGKLSADTPPYTTAEAFEKIQRLFTEGAQTFEWLARTREGRLFWVEVSLRLAVIGKQQKVLAVVRDIDQRKKGEEALRQSEMQFRTLAQIAPVGVIHASAGGDCLYVNRRWCELTGRPADLALGNGWVESLHPDDRQRIVETWDQSILTGVGFSAECRLLRPDGQLIWVYCQSLAERKSSGEIKGFVGTVTDISGHMAQRDTLERQVLERTAQLRAMAMELTKTEERERQVIAHELHDGLCQTLAVAKLKLTALETARKIPPWGSDIRLKVAAIEALIDEADQAARSLSLQLSPAILHELGLVPALEWLAEEMQRAYRLRVRVHDGGVPKHLDEAVRNPIFRATRELLINVAKHAQTDVAELALTLADDELVVSVTDSGVGFDANHGTTRSPKGGYGLLSVRERIGFIGGDMQIDSAPGDGTVVVLTVPLRARQAMAD